MALPGSLDNCILIMDGAAYSALRKAYRKKKKRRSRAGDKGNRGEQSDVLLRSSFRSSVNVYSGSTQLLSSQVKSD